MLVNNVGRRAQALTVATARIPAETIRQLRPGVLVDQAQQFTNRLVNANRAAARDLAAAAGSYAGRISGAVSAAGTDLEADASAVKEATRRSAFEQQGERQRAEWAIDRVETRTERHAAEEAEREAKAAAGQARREQRAARKRDLQASAALYEAHTKADLSRLLASRGLPKTGSRAELINRLVTDDAAS
jgi:SAP domain